VPGDAHSTLVTMDVLMGLCAHCEDALGLVQESGVVVDVVAMLRELGQRVPRRASNTQLAAMARACALVTMLVGQGQGSTGGARSPASLSSVGRGSPRGCEFGCGRGGWRSLGGEKGRKKI
jgi:hypothetical protein